MASLYRLVKNYERHIKNFRLIIYAHGLRFQIVAYIRHAAINGYGFVIEDAIEDFTEKIETKIKDLPSTK